jgi:hypothetical protein
VDLAERDRAAAGGPVVLVAPELGDDEVARFSEPVYENSLVQRYAQTRVRR